MSLLDSTSKQSYASVTFVYGTHVTGFTNAPRSLSGLLGSLTPEPALEVALPPNSGGIESEAATINLPLRAGEFSDAISIGEAFGRVVVIVEEHSTDLDLSNYQKQVLWRGEITQVVRNPSGRIGQVQIEAKEPKALLERPMGFVCTNQCANQFGKPSCGYDNSVNGETGKIVSIDHDLASLAFTTAKTGDWFENGVMVLDGTALKIRSWAGTLPTQFLLAQPVPYSWLDQTVTVYPGCNYTHSNCQAFGNEDRFLPLGIAIPAYNPTQRTS